MRLIIILATLLVTSSALADDYIIKCTKLGTVITRFNSLGAKARNPFVLDEQGNEVMAHGARIEDTLGDVMTPPQIYIPDGSLIFRVRLSAKDAQKLPQGNSPHFSILWKTGDTGPEPAWTDTEGQTVHVGRFAD